MWLTRIAINRPIIVWMLFLALTVMGIIAYFRLPLDLNPRVSLPTVTITTICPGAGPAEVEKQVSKPLEEAVGALQNVKDVYSSSQPNVSILSIDFAVGTDVDKDLSSVRDRVASLQSQLPSGAGTPIVARLDINAQPVLYLGLESATLGAEQIRRVADSVIAPRLQRVPGVGSVQALGGLKPEVEVSVDPLKLQQAGLTLDDVVQSLQASGRDISSGAITRQGSESDVRFAGAFTSISQIANAAVLPMSGGSASAQYAQSGQTPSPNLPQPPMTLQDVASVSLGTAPVTTIDRINGHPSVSLVVVKSPDASSVTAVAGVEEALKELRPSLPAHLHILTLRNDSTTVQDALHDVDFSLVLGAILAMGVILLFLQNLRGAFIVSLAIPACMLATFLVMSLAGFTLNQMTLLALSLSVGILVDDSIVVLESITRHLHRGEEPVEAALNGRAEIGFADLTTTLVDVVVFVPIAFTGGIVGGFFKQFGLSIVTATLFSLLVSFTVTPMMAARLYRKGENVEAGQGAFQGLEKTYRRMESLYKSMLQWALNHRLATVLTGATALGIVLFVTAGSLGFEFLPGIDQGEISVVVEMPPGASLQATDSAAREAEQTTAHDRDVKDVVTNVGEVLGGFGSIPNKGPQWAQLSIDLKPKAGMLQRLLGMREAGQRQASDEEVASRLRVPLTAIAERLKARITPAAVRSVIGISDPIEVQLRGPHTGPLADFAAQLRDRIVSLPGIMDPDVSVRSGRPELVVQPDALLASQYNVPTARAGVILRYAVDGEQAAVMQQNGEDIPVRISLAGLQGSSPLAVGQTPVGYDSQGGVVLLSDIASLSLQSGPTSIERENGERLVTVTANLAPGAALGNMQQKIQQIIDKMPHQGIKVHWGGDAETLDENVVPFALSAGMAALLVYTVMVCLFNSFGIPFVIMFSLPMAIAGAFAALKLTGENLSLVAAIGIIMLLGLMGRNAILLLDYVRTLRGRGMERGEAILEAGITRLRPILMTSLATIIGMLPVALRIGKASEIRAPMAVVVIGGLLVSTPLTLIMIPVVYSLFDDMVQKRRRGKAKGGEAGN